MKRQGILFLHEGGHPGFTAGIIRCAVRAFPSALPQAITVISSRESDAFPWTALDPFLATTLPGLWVMFIPV